MFNRSVLETIVKGVEAPDRTNYQPFQPSGELHRWRRGGRCVSIVCASQMKFVIYGFLATQRICDLVIGRDCNPDNSRTTIDTDSFKQREIVAAERLPCPKPFKVRDHKRSGLSMALGLRDRTFLTDRRYDALRLGVRDSFNFFSPKPTARASFLADTNVGCRSRHARNHARGVIQDRLDDMWEHPSPASRVDAVRLNRAT